MRGWLGLGLLSMTIACAAAACGGATQNDLFGTDGTTSSGTSSTSGDPGGGTATPTATATATTQPPTTQPCATQTFYRDRDGDGFGGTETKVACTSPGKEYVTKGGDCDDENENVFPGQTEYFATAYTPKGGNPSFDYDCSKKEDQQPPSKPKASTCTLSGNACLGSGYVPPGRTAPGGGVTGDPLCGATKYQKCEIAIGGPPGCTTTVITAENPVSCH